MKVVTFNIRCDYGQDGLNEFANRKELILRKISFLVYRYYIAMLKFSPFIMLSKFVCSLNILAYSPFILINSLCVPSSSIIPSFKKYILSEGMQL